MLVGKDIKDAKKLGHALHAVVMKHNPVVGDALRAMIALIGAMALQSPNPTQVYNDVIQELEAFRDMPR